MHSMKFRVSIGLLFGLCLCASVVWADDKPAGREAGEVPPDKQPQPQEIIYEVPQLEAIQIDGDDRDWVMAGLTTYPLVAAGGYQQRQPDDQAATVRIAWDERGLLVCVDVRDDHALEAPLGQPIYDYDSIEIFIADSITGKEKVQFLINPGISKDANGSQLDTRDFRGNQELKRKSPTITYEAVATDWGYRVEAVIPLDQIGIDTQIGTELAAQVLVNDRDSDKTRNVYAWFPEADTHRMTKHMHRIRLGVRPHTLATRDAVTVEYPS